MKNKNLFTIPALALAATMLFACAKGGSGKKPTPPTTYTVTFYSEGTVFDTQEVREHELAARPTTDPVKENYDFAGWYTAEEGGDEWIFSVNEVTEDTDLYARFELGRVDFTINLLLDGQVVDTKTTNSEDKTDVLLTAVTVGEGKSLLGYADVAGTTAADVDYRVGATLPYEDIVELADENFVVNLHAIVKTGEIVRLNMAVWGRYIDEATLQRIYGDFKTYADSQNVVYDFLDYEILDIKAVADFAAAILADGSFNVVFPSGSNFIDQTNVSTVYVKHAPTGTIVKTDGTPVTGRYVTTLSSDTLPETFYSWIISDAGKKACDPDYVVPTEHGEPNANQFVLGVWGRYYSDEYTQNLLADFKDYLDNQSISYEEVTYVYFGTTDYNAKADYLTAVSDDLSLDVIFPVAASIAAGTDSAIPTKLQPKIGHDTDLSGLHIGGETNRHLATLNEEALSLAFVTFAQTEDGKKAIDPSYGEQEDAQTVLTISFFGNYISLANANKICEEAESYFTSALINFTSVRPDYISAETATKNADYAAAISKDSDMSIGGGAKLSNDIFVAEGFTVTDRQNIGTIAGETNRYCSTFNNGALTTAFAAYLLSTEGQAFLATLTA